MMWKKKFPDQLEDRKKRYMGYFLLTQVCSEEEVGHGVNDSIYDLLKDKVTLFMFEQGMYLSVYYSLFLLMRYHRQICWRGTS